MKNLQLQTFIEFCKKRKVDDSGITNAVEDVRTFELELRRQNLLLDDCSQDQLKAYIKRLIQNRDNTIQRFVNLARYFYIIGREDIYLYFLSIIGVSGVIDSITRRTTQLTDEQTVERIMKEIQFPTLGSPPEDYPASTCKLVRRMQEVLPEEICKKALAGNHHKIPVESFEKEKEIYKNTPDFDQYLKSFHQRNVQELQKYSDEGTIWYEQKITPEVVEFVKNNQEVQGGVREGDIIYITKIPFDPVRYLQETDPDLKRFYACHCQFVRTALLTNAADVPPEWCYCSAGYVKWMFDVLFEQPVEADILETPFMGDNRCRFAIHIPPEVFSRMRKKPEEILEESE